MWFDLATDSRQAAVLDALESLVRMNSVGLILPEIVLEEFARNKARVLDGSKQSVAAHLRRAKEIVTQFGEGEGKEAAINELKDLSFRLPHFSEAAAEAVERIEKLFSTFEPVHATDDIVLRAANRGLRRLAPFHRPKNSLADAVIIEIYSEYVRKKLDEGQLFAFVTLNTDDFSDAHGDKRKPHEDVAQLFSTPESTYWINLSSALAHFEPGLLDEIRSEREWSEEFRPLAQIMEAHKEFWEKIWYDRHFSMRQEFDRNERALFKQAEKALAKDPNATAGGNVWITALKAVRRIEDKYGKENLGPWSSFEWGMLNGKLSAINWVTGDDWDSLDT